MLDVLREAHVEHLVGLVEDDDLDVVEHQRAARHVVDRAARCRDDHVDAAAQRLQLAPDRLAAVDRHDARGEVAAVLVDGFGHLDRELARGYEHEGRRRSPTRTGGQAFEERQRECRGLSRAGGSLAEQIVAFEQRRDGLALDRRRFLVAERRQRGQQLGPEPELGEADTVIAAGEADAVIGPGGADIFIARVRVHARLRDLAVPVRDRAAPAARSRTRTWNVTTSDGDPTSAGWIERSTSPWRPSRGPRRGPRR